MASLLSHPAVPLVVAAVLGPLKISRRLLLAAVAASILPDLDVVGYWLGVPYDHPFGHRGFTHSIAFGILLGLVAVPFAARLTAAPHIVFYLVALSVISHGVLDAMTDGGLGVALLWPFSDNRFFLPWRPIQVTPMRIDGLFSREGLRIVGSEIAVIWLPTIVIGGLAWRYAKKRSAL
jgi:inner membrane protein